jgi:hypothetical protein
MRELKEVMGLALRVAVYFRGYEAERETHVHIISKFAEGPSC